MYIAGQTGSLALVWQLVKEKENSEFKPVKLRLKNWPCFISYPSGGVGKYGKEARKPLMIKISKLRLRNLDNC